MLPNSHLNTGLFTVPWKYGGSQLIQLAGNSVSELWLPAPSKHCASASLLQENALGFCQNGNLLRMMPCLL